MGTSGSYSGGGGKPGQDLRDKVGDWLDSLPSNPLPDDRPGDHQDPFQLPRSAVFHAIRMFGTQGGSGGSGGAPEGDARGGRGGRGRTGGAQRSASGAARSAGRAAAAAYGYRTGNRRVLSDLGLDYDELRTLDDPLELTCRIVDVACGPQSESTIDHEEQRCVAAEIAEWVLTEQEAGAAPQPEEIARKAITFIIAEAMASETGKLIREGKRPAWATELAENENREAAEVLADQAELSVGGATADEFAKGIEDGIEALRTIYGETS